jgi:hypothetical protein
MSNIVYKLEDQSSLPKILELIPQAPNTWMKNYSPIEIDVWKKIFDSYCNWGDNFKISTAYQDNKLVSFSTALFSSTIPQWFHLQHFSIMERNGLSKTYLEHGIRLTDTLVRYGESRGYYSYLASHGIKHNAILDKIYNSPKRDKNYFRYNKLFEWYYKENDIPKFKTHSIFTTVEYFKFNSVINNYVLRQEFRPQNF